MNHSLLAPLSQAIARLHLPHTDDHRRHPAADRLHARSVAFLVAQGLAPDPATRRTLDRAAVVEGMVIALPDLAEPLLQLAVDWTNHNCLHDDAVEASDLGGRMDSYAVAALSRRYTEALRGLDDGEGAHPLVRAMVSWRRRALALELDEATLERFAARAGAMASQFALERLMADHGVRLDEQEYLRQRVSAGPFDAWFALILMVLGPERQLASVSAEALRRSAVEMTVCGNELRTCARELAQGIEVNLIARAADPEAAILRLLDRHNACARRFQAAVARLPDDPHRALAAALARAVYATHVYELRSIRGLALAA